MLLLKEFSKRKTKGILKQKKQGKKSLLLPITLPHPISMVRRGAGQGSQGGLGEINRLVIEVKAPCRNEVMRHG